MIMGISGTRVWFYMFPQTTDTPSNEFFSRIFWLGLGVNLLIVEIWINLTREIPASAAQAVAVQGESRATALSRSDSRSETCPQASA